MKWDELGEKFYYADENEGKFIEAPKNIFLEQFECYKTDLEKNNGIRPWETIKQEKISAISSENDKHIIATDDRR